MPQLPPQPSSPHFLPVQSGVHWSTHLPSAQNFGQLPQELPQPLSPQTFPVQEPEQVGWQSVPSLEQNASPQQLPHSLPQPSGPQILFLQSGVQTGPPSPASDPASAGELDGASSAAAEQPRLEKRSTRSARSRTLEAYTPGRHRGKTGANARELAPPQLKLHSASGSTPVYVLPSAWNSTQAAVGLLLSQAG